MSQAILNTRIEQPLASSIYSELWSRLLPWSTCAAITLVAVLSSTDFQHWFVLPVFLCGGYVASLAVPWLLGRREMFDPLSIFGLVGIHFFFAAPILHVATSYWMPYISPPGDWRPWLGAMASLNAAGLAIFHICRIGLGRCWPTLTVHSQWEINSRRFYWLAGATFFLCTILQTLVYAKFGGIAGYVQAFSDQSEQFNGMGIVFLFSEAAPIVALMIAVHWARQHSRRTLAVALVILVSFVLLKFYFGGLRGSRGHLIYGLFWVACLLDKQIFPLPRKLLFIGIALLLPFMYAYGLYKSFGTEAVQALSAAGRADLLDSAPRNWQGVLLGDLGRSDVQAFMLYRLSPECVESHYDCVGGQTYVGSIALLIPRSVMPNRPLPKARAGTDLLFGLGVYENEMASTFAFGLTGEALLNFSWPGGLLSFVVIGAGMVLAQRCYYGLPPDDCRWFVLPLFLSLSFLGLLWDTDVLLFYVVKEGSVPCLLLLLTSRRTSSPSSAGALA